MIAAIFFILAIFFIVHYARSAKTPYAKAVNLVNAGKTAAALPILEELSRQHPENPLLFPWLAKAYLGTERLAEGRVALDTALRLRVPKTPLSSVVLAYANYYEARGDYAEAENLYESAVNACPEKELSEGRANLYLKWAQSASDKGDIEDAKKHLEAAYLLQNQISQPLAMRARHCLSDVYRQLASLAEKHNDDDQCIAYLQKSLAISDELAGHVALASIYARLKKTEEAIEQYEIVTRDDTNDLEARHRLIDLLCERGDYARAQSALADLTDMEKSVENFQLLAFVDLKLGNYAGAVRAYEDACDLRPKPELLKQLEKVLIDWSNLLTKEKKTEEALAVKGHADRVADQLSLLMRTEKEKNDVAKSSGSDENSTPPIALSFSHIWLARGSLTPEGEIKIKNITAKPINDLSLTAVFYDNTARQNQGSVSLPVTTAQSAPFEAGGARSLYFSCPNIVKTDHQLAVIIFWRGHLLKEFPVVKS